MRETPVFEDWSRNVYPQRFPIPPRDSCPLTAEEAAGAGFHFIAAERYENDTCFTLQELVAYLMTQTNVAAAIKQGRESLESAAGWLLAQVWPFFTAPAATCVFVTRAWYLQKEALP